MFRKELSWSKSTFSSALLAAVFAACYSANDNYIMHNIIICPKDRFTANAFCLILGSWIGFVCTIIYNKSFSRWIDNDYPGFNFGNVKMQVFALISGAFSAGSTIFYLVGSQNLDPSLVIALSSASILYLVIYDVLLGYIKFKNIILPGFIVICGSVLASVIKLSGEIKITVLGILILLGGRCLLEALKRIFTQRGVWQSDALTFNIWRFFWFALLATLFMPIIALIRGRFGELMAMRESLAIALPWLIFTIFFAFFSSSFFQKAIQSGAVSKVSLVFNLQIILGIPITLVVNSIKPMVFGELPSNSLIWLVRAAGAILIIVGITLLKHKQEAKT